LLIGTLVPTALWEVAPELLKGVLRVVIRDSSSGPYGFDHLSGLGVLDGFGFVLLVGFWEWWGDNCIQDARCETVQEEADGFFASDGVSCAADELFEVCDVLVYLGEAHLTFVKVEPRPLLFLQVREVFREFLYECVPGKLYVVHCWV
jgi:hypothetical protein